MSHVFISYSKHNRDYARTLADKLLELGFDVWIDDRIDYGDDWELAIFDAIDRCAAYLVIMTPDSWASKWVRRECNYAEKRMKPLFPVLLDGEEFPRYTLDQYVDVRNGKLPPDDFYNHLAQSAPRKVIRGSKLDETMPSSTPALDKLEIDLKDVPNFALSRKLHSIMVIEGLSTLTKRLKNLLEVEEFSLRRYQSGKDAILDLRTDHFELIILDQYLEGENALVVCREIRKQTTIPILMIADKVSNQERARAVQSGADHLVTAATSSKELLDTIRMIVDPNSTVANLDSLVLGDLYVDFASRAVFLKNTFIELTRIEFDILRTLIVNRGQTVTHEQLLAEVWGPGYESESQYLWISISRLRKKLESKPDSPRYIRTQSGIGYYFSVP